jgi:hypothetical protein
MKMRVNQTVKDPTIPDQIDRSAFDILRKADWLAPNGDVCAAYLAPHAQWRTFSSGEQVLSLGVPVRQLVMLIEGSLACGLTDAHGRRLVIDQLSPGTVVGLAALFDARASLQEVKASSDSLLLLIPRAAVLQAIRDLPGFAETLLRLMSNRVRGLLVNYANRSMMSLRTRLAGLLARLAMPNGRRHRRDGTAHEPNDILMPQEDLAAMLGVTRQHRSQPLKELEREGLIKLHYRRITVLQMPGLRKLAGRSREPATE